MTSTTGYARCPSCLAIDWPGSTPGHRPGCAYETVAPADWHKGQPYTEQDRDQARRYLAARALRDTILHRDLAGGADAPPVVRMDAR